MTSKSSLIPASLDVAERDVVTHGQWLRGEMEARGITNSELFKGMSRLGYSKKSSTIVAMWRADSCTIGLDTLPYLLGALGMHGDEMRAWVIHFTCANHPELAPYLKVAA